MPHRTRVAILGSTGSIGRQAVEVIRAHPDHFEALALVAGSDRDALEEQARTLGVKHIGLGAESAAELASLDAVDIVLNAVVGAAGLPASLAALRAGKVLALANKESLVAGGELCLQAQAAGRGRIVAVDSEHAAIAQCLEGRDTSEVERIVLTASGGPFRTRPNLSGVTPEEALAHPTWSMGPKITIDSATLMNKGLEVIEAHHLFGLEYERIEVLVHPQSVVHGIVEFIDSSIVMQAGPPDMKIPIQAALSAPARLGTSVMPLDLAGLGHVSFEPVDHDRFPALGLAYEVGKKGATYPAALNAANEVAVAAFLDGRIPFLRITSLIEDVLSAHDPVDAGDLDAVLAVDEWARDRARAAIEGAAG